VPLLADRLAAQEVFQVFRGTWEPGTPGADPVVNDP